MVQPSFGAVLTALHPSQGTREIEEAIVTEAPFTPFTTSKKIVERKTEMKRESGYGVLPMSKRGMDKEGQEKLFGQILVKWGRQNVNLHALYKKYHLDIGGARGLPGIYVICACVESGPLNGLTCANCSALTNELEDSPKTSTPLLFKVGIATDLAHRFDQYHSYYPYGFTVIRVFVMTDPNGNLLPDSTEAGKLLKHMEAVMLSAFRDVCDFNPTTRPGSAEFFRMAASDVTEGLLKNTLMRLTSWDAEFVEKWKALKGERARLPVDKNRNVVYSFEGVRGILQPYGRKNFSSLTSASSARTRGQATMTAHQAVSAQAEGSYASQAGRLTKEAKKSARRTVPGGAAAASSYSEGSEGDYDSDEGESEYVQSGDEGAGSESDTESDVESEVQ